MKGRRRILTLTSSFPRGPEDISGKFVKDLSTRLARTGNEIIVLTPHSIGTSVREIIDDVEVRRFRYMYPERWEKLGGRAMLSQVRSEFHSRLLLPFFFLGELFSTLRLTRERDVDLLHSHWAIPQGLVGAFVGKITNRPHLLTTHSAGLFALEELPFTRTIADFIARNSEGITCVSSYGERKLYSLISPNLVNETKERTFIVPMGVDIERFDGKDKDELRRKYSIDPDVFLLMFVGRLDEVKGVEYLIQAMETLEKENIKLWIVGDGPLEGRLKNLAEDLGLERAVFFAGRRTGDDLNDMFVIADVIVVPSIVTSRGDTEGLPVVILESLAAGKPVIATSVGGIPDAIEDEETGILVQDRSPDGVIEAVRRLLGNRELCDSLGKNAMKKAKSQYSWHAISERFESIIQNIVQRRDH